MLNLLDHPTCFAPADRLCLSAWLEHFPFAAYLVDVLRPATLVELGTHTGFSYAAFCQAVRALNLGTRCFAVDTWRGDEHSGAYGSEVLAELRGHLDPLYGGFSTLLPAAFDEALVQFPDQGIDLLHIDGFHTHEAVRHDFAAWLPKMSRRGVVLLHDTNVRERDFGVWRFWDEVRGRYPSFEFIHGHGLGVLAVGDEPPEGLRTLFEAGDEEVARIRIAFARLGAQHSQRFQTARLVEEIGRQAQAVAALQGELADRDARLAALGAEVTDRDARLVTLGAELADRDARLVTLGAELADRDARLAALGAEVADRDARLVTLGAELADRDARLAALGAEVADRDARLAGLADDLADRDRAVEDVSARLAAREQCLEEQVREGRMKARWLDLEVAARDARIEALEAEAAAQDRSLAALSAELADVSGGLAYRAARWARRVLAPPGGLRARGLALVRRGPAAWRRGAAGAHAGGRPHRPAGPRRVGRRAAAEHRDAA